MSTSFVDDDGTTRFRGRIVGGGPFLVAQTAGRAFTSAEILNLPTVPIELVPSPGAGLVLVPLWLTWIYRFVTTPYDLDGNLSLDWGGTTFGLINVNAALLRTADKLSYGYATAEARKDIGDVEDKSLVVSLDSAIADGDGTGFAVVSYMTVPVA